MHTKFELVLLHTSYFQLWPGRKDKLHLEDIFSSFFFKVYIVFQDNLI